MALPLTAYYPKFSITFILGTTNTLTFTDLITTGYSSVSGYTSMKGLVMIKDPDGIIIYTNSGFSVTAPDFSSPDIQTSGSTWTKTGISLPLDSNGLVKRGVYVFEYIVSVDGGSNYVRVLDSLTNLPKSYDFQYQPAVVSIDHTIDCLASTLTSEDTTNYSIYIGSTLYNPTTQTRSHTIKEPLGSGFSPTPGATTDKIRVVGGGDTEDEWLWTKEWQTLISTTVVYPLATWNSFTWIIVNDIVTGYQSTDVECDNCGCNLSQCYKNLVQRYLDSESGNKKNAFDLRIKVTLASAYWIEYQNGRNCGEDTSVSCNKLKDILAGEDCSCGETVDSASHSIRPISAGLGIAVSASDFVFGYGTGTPTGGKPDDMYLQNVDADEQYIWRNVAGTWIRLFNIVGAAGAPGVKGDTGNTGNNGESIYSYLRPEHTLSGTLEETLIEQPIDYELFTREGDCIYFTGNLLLGKNDNGKTIKLYFHNNMILSYFTDKLIDDDNKYVRVECWITWVDDSNVCIEASISDRNTNKFIADFFAYAPVVTLGTISITGQNSVASAYDISAVNSRSEYKINHILV